MSLAQICPDCGSRRRWAAAACSCGHQFKAKFTAPPPPFYVLDGSRPKPREQKPRVVGVVLLVFGALAIGISPPNLWPWIPDRSTLPGVSSPSLAKKRPRVGMTAQEVTALLGEPTSKTPTAAGEYWGYSSGKEQLHLILVSDRVTEIVEY